MGTKEALALVEKTNVQYGGDTAKLEKELKRLIKQGRESGDTVLVGVACRALGVVEVRLGRRDEALSDALKAVALLEETGDYNLMFRAYMFLGFAYDTQESFQMALANYDKAYQIIKKHRIQGMWRIYTLNNIASCYHTMGDLKTSIRLFGECLRLGRLHTPEDYTDLVSYGINLADCLMEAGEPEKAMETLKSMAEWIDRVDMKAMACDYYIRLALTAYKMDHAAEGSEYVDKALDIAGEASTEYVLYEDLREAAHILVTNGRREPAEKIAGLMRALAKKSDHTMDQLTANRMLADYYKNIGEYERAMEYYERLDGLFDKRLRELKSIQLNVHKKIRGADAEIHKLNQRVKESEEQASVEPLTKLLNRTALLRVASEFIETATRKREKVGAIFLDIDYFKECNDTYGHAKGDEIIREVARACRKEETEKVRFARYGGDEFFGITHGLRDEEVAEVARRICARVRKLDIPNKKNPNGGRVTLSAGVVNIVMTERTNTIIDIANYADKAVYHAKNTGKNAIYLLDHERRDEEDKDALFVKIDF